MPSGWGESEVDMPMAPELGLEDTPASFDWRGKGMHFMSSFLLVLGAALISDSTRLECAVFRCLIS